MAMKNASKMQNVPFLKANIRGACNLGFADRAYCAYLGFADRAYAAPMTAPMVARAT